MSFVLQLLSICVFACVYVFILSLSEAKQKANSMKKRNENFIINLCYHFVELYRTIIKYQMASEHPGFVYDKYENNEW